MVLHDKFAFESLLYWHSISKESRAYVYYTKVSQQGAVKSIYGYVKSMKITIIMESI